MSSPSHAVDVERYLERIGYAGPLAPSATLLQALHRQHMLSVPFENLDIRQGRRIVCAADAFLSKIIDRGRGGFCYELNGAFSELLRALGFNVTLLSARVTRDSGELGPEFDHLTLRVDLDEPWLADVGFGDSFVEPLRLQAGVEQLQESRAFRLVADGSRLHMEMRDSEAPHWVRQYAFALQPRQIEEFADMCNYHQTSAGSSFTQQTICSMATIDGRVTLTDNELITTHHGIKQRTLVSADDWPAVLHAQFGLSAKE